MHISQFGGMTHELFQRYCVLKEYWDFKEEWYLILFQKLRLNMFLIFMYNKQIKAFHFQNVEAFLHSDL